MKLSLTKHFDIEQGASSNRRAIATEKMGDAVQAALVTAEVAVNGYSVVSEDEESIGVEATIEWTDIGYLLQMTEGWRSAVHANAGKRIRVDEITPYSDGANITGSITVGVRQQAQLGLTGAESTVKSVASGELGGAFGRLNRFTLRNVHENGTERNQRFFDVDFSLVIPYRNSVLGSQILRQQFRQFTPSGEWDSITKSY